MKLVLAGIVLLIVSATSPGAGERPKLVSLTSAAPAGYRRGVLGSKHDFTGLTERPGAPCRACHIPHMQAVRPALEPGREPAVEMFRMGGERRVFVPGRYTPGPASLICLGCHDGTVATSTIGSAHALLGAVREGFAVPDGFVWRDHPIGVPYPRDRRKFRPAATVSAEGKVRLPDGRIECVSCHDPHNRSGLDKMLVKSNRRSALCLTCHLK